MSIAVQVVNTSWGSSTSAQIADLGRRISNLEAARTVIEAGTITAGTIAANSITTTEIAAGTIQASDIATGTITATQIAAGTITATQIAANTITAGNIAAGTITATQIAAGSITTGNIAAGAITASLIQAGAINAGHIQAASIDASRLVANTITAGQIAAATITSTQIAAGTITAGNIAAGTITATQIAATTILGTNIAAATITAGNIASHTITAAVIAAGTITATEIASATITGGLIAGTTITAANIAAATITSTQLATDSVTSTQIISGAVTSTKISVSSLSAISANLGTITAGTITGATVQTAASGARVVLNTGGITAYNAANVPQLAFDVSTGNLTLTGTVTANASSVLPVAALTGGVIGSGNLVQDGGLEDSLLSSWTNNSNAALTSTTAQVRSGSRAGVMTASVGDYPAAVLAASATYHWKFNETSGTTAASDATANNGTYTGTFTLNQTGLAPGGGGAVLFDGSTAEVTTAVQVNPNTLTALTISIGFKTTTSNGGALIGLVDTQTGPGSQHDRMVWMDTAGKLKFGFWNGSGSIILVSPASYNDGVKHVVHAVLQSNWNMLLYVDGTLVASNTNTTAPAAYTAPTTAWWRIGRTTSFGGWDSTTNVWFAGTLDEPAIWNSALSAGQITTLASSFASSASGDMSIIPVAGAQAIAQPGAAHTAQAYFKAAATSRTVRVHINWYTSAGAFISQSASTATTTDNTTAFTRTTLTANAPGTAAFARVVPEVVSPAAAEVHYVDDVALVAGNIAADVPTIPNNTIIGGMVLADQITAREIAASTITAVEIAAATITAGNIAAGTITATEIAAGTITATQLTSTAIDSMVITGATIRTNSNAQINQVILDNLGLRAYGDLLSVPSTPTLGTFAVGGTLATGTYYYKVSATNSQGVTTASSEASIAITLGQRVTVTVPVVPGATGYRIFRGTSAGAENVYYDKVSNAVTGTVQFVDTGAASTAGAPPGTNTAKTIPINVTTTGLGTITGATVQSSETNPKVILDRSGLRMTDATGVDAVRLDIEDGLTMRSFAGSYGALTFVDPATGLKCASVTGGANIITVSNLNTGTGASQAVVVAEGSSDGITQTQTRLLLQSGANAGSIQGSLKVRAGIAGGGISRELVLVDGTNASSYLQHITTSSRRFNMGVASTPGFANGNRVSGTIAHSLGFTPQGAIITCTNIAVFSGEASDSAINASVTALSSTNISVLYRIDSGFSNNSASAYWIAWG